MSSTDARARDIIARQSYIHWATNLGSSATFDDAPAEGRQLLLSEADAILTALSAAGITLAGPREVASIMADKNQRIADLIAERDALAERVRRYEAFVAACDAFDGPEWWLQSANGDDAAHRLYDACRAARAAIAEAGE